MVRSAPRQNSGAWPIGPGYFVNEILTPTREFTVRSVLAAIDAQPLFPRTGLSMMLVENLKDKSIEEIFEFLDKTIISVKRQIAKRIIQ